MNDLDALKRKLEIAVEALRKISDWEALCANKNCKCREHNARKALSEIGDVK